MANKGAGWTKLYPLVDVIDIIPEADRFDEDKYVKIYMEKYGVGNVRGGSYVQVVLPEWQRLSLDRELATAKGTCFQCGSFGHYIDDCPSNKKNQGAARNIVREIAPVRRSRKPVNPFEESTPIQKKENNCFRCGRDGHWAGTCYAKTHANGSRLD